MPYKNLTDEQWDAVRHEGDLLLTACPGSGKTKTLVSKLCYLLEKKEILGLGKKKIIALTYTNIAADTIYERLMSYGVDTKYLWIGTIHSFCLNWIIKPNVDRIPRLSKGFSVIDEHEKDFLINELKEKYGLGFFDQVSTMLTPDFKPQYVSNDIKFTLVKDYHRSLNANRLIDFDLILNITLRLLSIRSSLCKRLSLLFSHILIDEYQDTSFLQYEILRLIYSDENNILTLIGDKEQAIYTGLGAIVKHKKELSEFFAINNLTDMKLTGCFRSSQSIVDFYSKYKDEKFKILSLSKLKNFNSVIHKEDSVDKSQLPQYVVGIIKTHLDQGISPNEIAVLCPSWFDVIKLSNEILLLSNDFEIDGVTISPIPKNTENIWLRFIKLFFVKRVPSNFIIRQKIVNEFVADLSLHSPNSIFYSSKVILSKINHMALVTDYDANIGTWLKIVITDFCAIFNLDLHEGGFFYSEMNSLINASLKRMKKYDMVYQASDLPSFFNSRSGVKITTCHSTKGDEYEVVICTGLLKGKIPHWDVIFKFSPEYSDYTARRLLYVISSRAKKHLYMISECGHTTKSGVPYSVTPQL
ncbi:UvrD-helicase domain-containing protein [Pectobacterium versatile]|uniref:UvrD-helicase domain-containing protein n=1 Tax=Pectobacterium versatile TaxID=2488639 RepID=UPI00102E8E0A|nr:ATP-dependent helicase [Pectobacterium versatile]TAI92075.1 ATP-dependent helicase [Pectobacterium versatile]